MYFFQTNHGICLILNKRRITSEMVRNASYRIYCLCIGMRVYLSVQLLEYRQSIYLPIEVYRYYLLLYTYNEVIKAINEIEKIEEVIAPPRYKRCCYSR